MKKQRFISKITAWILIFSLCIGLYTPVSEVQAANGTVLETNVSSPSSGCTMLGVYGTYYADAENALARINEIRKEACDAGNVPDPRNTSRMLTSSDYVPIQWSQALEQIARWRAVEGGLAFGLIGSGHNRLNGGSIWFSYGGTSSFGEDLAYNNGTSLISGINQWYGEKDAWIAYTNTSSYVTGHYSSIINPDYTYIGLGDFYTTASTYRNTLAGELSSSCGSMGTTPLPGYSGVMQKVEVKNSYIDSYYLDGETSMYIGNTQTLTPMAKLINGSKTTNLWVVEDVIYQSSDTMVATVSEDGLVTAKAKGTTTITATANGSPLATLTLTVDCEHEKVLQSVTDATCSKTGKKVYQCSLCNDIIEEEIAMIPHSYVYGEADSSGVATGVCSVCEDTISIIPPTSYSVMWRNSESSSQYYWSYVPEDNPVGSSILCWIKNVDGQSGYQDMVIESSNSDVLAFSKKIISGDYYLEVKKGGIVTVSIYPQYNPAVKKTFTIRTGGAGTVGIEDALVSLPQTSYEYDGKEKKPVPKVVYDGITLTKGTDYTVDYENNIETGTATCVITGNGIFTGIVKKEFTIAGLSLEGATVTLDKTSYEYDGTEKTPVVTVKKGTTILKSGVDYTVTYQNNVAIGTATVVVKGMGNYAGTMEKAFSIVHTSHTYGDWESISAGNCVTKGQEKRSCKYCDAYEIRDTDFGDHEYEELEEEAPTYRKKGHLAGSACKYCGESELEGGTIPELTFTVSFNGNGKTEGNMESQKDLSYLTGGTLSCNQYGRKGYTFTGWNSEANGSGKVFEDKDDICKLIDMVEASEDGTVVLYAQWEPITYSIRFNGNGAISGSMPAMSDCKYASAYTLTANVFKRTGYTFVCWNTKADGTGISYMNKASVRELTGDASSTVTLYAVWRIDSYKITYKLNGGKNVSSNPKSYSVTTSTITLKKPTRKGYTFVGWYSDSACKNKVTKITKGSTGNKTLYAKWTLTKYKITYKLNGGKNNRKNPVKYTYKTATITLKKPTRKGYTFVGWYSDAACKKKVTKIKKGSTGNKKLYAKWKKKK